MGPASFKPVSVHSDEVGMPDEFSTAQHAFQRSWRPDNGLTNERARVPACVRLASTERRDLMRAWNQLCDELIMRYPANASSVRTTAGEPSAASTQQWPRRAHPLSLEAFAVVLHQALASRRPIQVSDRDGKPSGIVHELIAEPGRIHVGAGTHALTITETAGHRARITSRAGDSMGADCLEIHDVAQRRVAGFGCIDGAQPFDRGAWAGLLAGAQHVWPGG